MNSIHRDATSSPLSLVTLPVRKPVRTSLWTFVWEACCAGAVAHKLCTHPAIQYPCAGRNSFLNSQDSARVPSSMATCRHSNEFSIDKCVCDRVAPNDRLMNISLTCELPRPSLHPVGKMRATNNGQLGSLTAAVKRSGLSCSRPM